MNDQARDETEKDGHEPITFSLNAAPIKVLRLFHPKVALYVEYDASTLGCVLHYMKE